MMIRLLATTALALSLVHAPAALAQEAKPPVTCALTADEPGRYGEVFPEMGRELVIDVEAGGPFSPGTCHAECYGFVSAQPDLVVTTDGASALRIAGQADTDTTLVVRDADGTFTCNDDSPNGADPEVQVRGDAGPYAVWLGVYGPAGTAPARLIVGAMDPATMPGDAVGCTAETAALGTGQSAGVCAGGATALSTLDGNCAGFAQQEPTARITAETAGRLELVALSMETDLVMAVLHSDGRVSCNDDAFGYSPMVSTPVGEGETVDVWVGLLESGAEPRTVFFSSLLR